MPRRRSPWLWPACTALALAALLAAAFLIPRAWIIFLPDPRRLPTGGPDLSAWRGMTLLPPVPEVVVEPQPPPAGKPPPRPAPAPEDPTWWTSDFTPGSLIESRAALLDAAGPAPADSAAVLLRLLQVPPAELLASARPDSLLQARLLRARVEGALSIQELKPYLAAMARQQIYRNILANAADLYDDFLSQQIVTPD